MATPYCCSPIPTADQGYLPSPTNKQLGRTNIEFEMISNQVFSMKT